MAGLPVGHQGEGHAADPSTREAAHAAPSAVQPPPSHAPEQAPPAAPATPSPAPHPAAAAAPLPVRYDVPFKAAKDQVLRTFEREYLQRLLDRTGGNVARAAREAGLDRKHLYSLLHKHLLLEVGSG